MYLQSRVATAQGDAACNQVIIPPTRSFGFHSSRESRSRQAFPRIFPFLSLKLREREMTFRHIFHRCWSVCPRFAILGIDLKCDDVPCPLRERRRQTFAQGNAQDYESWIVLILIKSASTCSSQRFSSRATKQVQSPNGRREKWERREDSLRSCRDYQVHGCAMRRRDETRAGGTGD